MRSLALAAVAAALAVGACATPTAYGPADARGAGGYSETRLERDRYRVTFAGNSLTSREQVEMALLLRAAELTVADGYDWFATVNRATDRDSRLVASPDITSSRYSPFWSPYWRYWGGGAWRPFDPWARDVDYRQIDRFEASAEILMGRGPKPAGDPNAFDAREVVSNLSGQVPRRPQ